MPQVIDSVVEAFTGVDEKIASAADKTVLNARPRILRTLTKLSTSNWDFDSTLGNQDRFTKAEVVKGCSLRGNPEIYLSGNWVTPY